MLELALSEVSIKNKTGPPNDAPDTSALPFWADVLPLSLSPEQPKPAQGVRDEPPLNVRDWSDGPLSRPGPAVP